MKKIFSIVLTSALTLSLTGCLDGMEDYENGSLNPKQAQESSTSFEGFVSALTANLMEAQQNGGATNPNPYDYGYPSIFLMRDAMTSDIVCSGGYNWYRQWYQITTSSAGLDGNSNRCRYPWAIPYLYINNCNNVITMGSADEEKNAEGLGIAYAYRAMFYLDLARTYGIQPYWMNGDAQTAVIVTDQTDPNVAIHNPRAANTVMYAQILSDLDNAERYLQNQTFNVYLPSLSFVYGLKARTYLEMQDWANAEHYAQLAQQGHPMMSNSELVNKDTGFNTANSSWIFGIHLNSTSHVVQWAANNGSGYGSQWCLEMYGEDGSFNDCAYASTYGAVHKIDRHLYESIPSTDVRKDWWIDWKYDLNGLYDENGNINEAVQQAQIDSLTRYAYNNDRQYAVAMANTGVAAGKDIGVGGLSLKLRAKGGDEGRHNIIVGWAVDVPMMRTEEMKLIEIEAVARQDEARGRQMLEEFAKTRDPQYVYGRHNEAYGNSTTPALINEIWWQRRVELWGEGFAYFDLKRLNKGIIRSYKNSNHTDMYRFNNLTADEYGCIFPNWLRYTNYNTEAQFNDQFVGNPIPTVPTGNSPEFDFGN